MARVKRSQVRNRSEYKSLTDNEREARSRSLQAISIMRENPSISLSEAAHQAHTSPKTVRQYASEGLTPRGRIWLATPADRIYRPMVVYSAGEVTAVDVRGSRKASELSEYHQAVSDYLDTGDESGLRPFQGKSVAGVEYETDPDVLDEMARRNQLDIESIYQLVQ
jgi:hypothetical protein